MGVKLRERPGKGWYVFTDWQGQRKAKCFGKNKRLAQAFADKLTARLKWAEHNGEPLALSQPDQTMPTVKAYLGDWLTTYAKVHCKPSTYRGYKRAIEQHLIPAFGERPLHLLKRDEIKRLIARQIEAQKARGTIQNYLVPLKAAYNQAKEDGLVMLNPAERLGKLLQRSQDRREEMQPLTAQEVQTLLSRAESQYPALYPVLLCAVRTGLRQGELIGLQWGDVDSRGQFLDVRRGVVLGEVTTTKSKKMRRVDLSPQVLAALQRVKEIRQLQAMNRGEELLPWVFLSPEGMRWDERNLRRGFYRCLDAAGIRQVRFHDLRHTYASLMAEAGAPPKYVQRQLGHSSFQVTMDIYSHLFPDGNREWVAKLDCPVSTASWEGQSATQAQPEAIAPGDRIAN
jgi:integrase